MSSSFLSSRQHVHLFLRPTYANMAAGTGPGIDSPGEWFIASVNTTALALGKARAINIDNAAKTPTAAAPVTVNGATFTAVLNAGTGAVTAATVAAGVDLSVDAGAASTLRLGRGAPISVSNAGKTSTAAAPTTVNGTTFTAVLNAGSGAVTSAAVVATGVDLSVDAGAASTLRLGRGGAISINNGINPPVVSVNGAVFTGGTSGYFGTTEADSTETINTTLTSDVYYRNMIINPGVEVKTGGYRIFVNGTLTLGTGSSISNNGTAGAAGGAAGSTPATHTVGTGGAGGGPTAAGAAGVASVFSTVATGASGAGNPGGNGAGGGAAGARTLITADNGGILQFQTAVAAILARDLGGNKVTGGVGGGGGGGGAATNSGGGGGGGGGVVMIAANTISGAGAITANGGDGGAATGTGINLGGTGGGGGGGTVILVYKQLTGGFTVNQITAAVGPWPHSG
jgi:hypothetical protein